MSDKIEIKVPNLGDITDVEILEIFVSPGDSIEQEDPLLSLETDKAVMEVPSPAKGTIESITVKVGDTISEGDLIGYLLTDDSSGDSADKDTTKSEPVEKQESSEPKKAGDKTNQENDTQEKPLTMDNSTEPKTSKHNSPELTTSGNNSQNKTESPSAPAPSLGGTFHASPSIRKFARELGADLNLIEGTGPKNRITKEDVQNWIKSRLKENGNPLGNAVNSLPPVNLKDFEKHGEVITEKLGRIKKISGQRLQASWQNIPHVTHFDEADITKLDQFRKDLNNQLKNEGTKITALAFIIKAVVKALEEFPQFNSSLSGDQLYIKKYYNIGFAAETPEGLMVPVIHGADNKGLKEIAAELMELSGKAREKKLESKYLMGGTFTISSLGGIGGTNFTPVINPPEAAILGVSRSKWSPVWTGKDFEPRLMLPFGLSYDHRIIDGAQAARFCKLIAEILTDFRLYTL